MSRLQSVWWEKEQKLGGGEKGACFPRIDAAITGCQVKGLVCLYLASLKLDKAASKIIIVSTFFT